MLILIFFFHTAYSRKLKVKDTIPVFGSSVNSYDDPFQYGKFEFVPNCFTTTNTNKDFYHKLRMNTKFSIQYKVPISNKYLCSLNLSRKDSQILENLIRKDFVYEIYNNKLPVWIKIGEIDSKNQVKIYTHFQFIFGFRVDHIVDTSVIPSNPKLLNSQNLLQFSYSVEWQPSRKRYRQRFERYSDYDYMDSDLRINSIYLSLSMLVIISVITFNYLIKLRRNGNDTRKDKASSDLFDYTESEQNVAAIRNNILHPPPRKIRLAYLLSVGSQILFTLLLFSITTLIKRLSFNRMGQLIVILVAFAVSSFLTMFNMKETILIWSIPNLRLHIAKISLVISSSYLISDLFVWITNTLFGPTRSSKIYITFVISMIIFLISFVSMFIGNALSLKKLFFEKSLSAIRRKIPNMPFYLTNTFICFIVGIIGWNTIYLEFNFILSSIWLHKLYYTYLYLVITLPISILIVGASGLLANLIRFANENYEWQWLSFLSPAITGFYSLIQSFIFGYNYVEFSGCLHFTHYIFVSLVLSLIVALIYGYGGFAISSYVIRFVFDPHRD